MFKSLSAFKSTTKVLHTALKTNPKLKIGQLRELIARSTPYGSMAAYEASFTNQKNKLAVLPDLEKTLDNEWNRLAASNIPTFEETMHNEFNRLAHLSMAEYMGNLSYHDASYIIKNYTSERLNKNVPNIYELLLRSDKGLFDAEIKYFHLKEATHNMGVLMYSLPPVFIDEAKSQESINASWETVLNKAFFNKLRKSLFAILEIIEIEHFNKPDELTTQGFFDAFIAIAKTHPYNKDVSIDTQWEEVGAEQSDYVLMENTPLTKLTESSLLKLLESNRTLIEIIGEQWDDSDGAAWSDLDIIDIIDKELPFDISLGNPLFDVIQTFFNQTCNFILVGYTELLDFQNGAVDKGQDLSNDTYYFVSDARKAILESDFDEYELIWVRSSNGEESETYTLEEFKTYKAENK